MKRSQQEAESFHFSTDFSKQVNQVWLQAQFRALSTFGNIQQADRLKRGQNDDKTTGSTLVTEWMEQKRKTSNQHKIDFCCNRVRKTISTLLSSGFSVHIFSCLCCCVFRTYILFPMLSSTASYSVLLLISLYSQSDNKHFCFFSTSKHPHQFQCSCFKHVSRW